MNSPKHHAAAQWRDFLFQTSWLVRVFLCKVNLSSLACLHFPSAPTLQIHACDSKADYKCGCDGCQFPCSGKGSLSMVYLLAGIAGIGLDAYVEEAVKKIDG